MSEFSAQQEEESFLDNIQNDTKIKSNLLGVAHSGSGEDYKRYQWALEDVPPLYKSSFIKSMRGELSPRQAIYAKCRSCVGCEETIIRVKECRSMACPIWAYRPYQN